MDTPPANPTPVPPVQAQPPIYTGKKRHGCLTTWLILMIIGNFYSIIANLVSMKSIINFYGTSTISVLLLCLLGVANILFVIALFRWKKWGFYGFAASSVLVFILNLAIGLKLWQSIAGLVGIAILYGVLQIGDQASKGWPQLE